MRTAYGIDWTHPKFLTKLLISLAHPTGFEPVTSAFGGQQSNLCPQNWRPSTKRRASDSKERLFNSGSSDVAVSRYHFKPTILRNGRVVAARQCRVPSGIPSAGECGPPTRAESLPLTSTSKPLCAGLGAHRESMKKASKACGERAGIVGARLLWEQHGNPHRLRAPATLPHDRSQRTTTTSAARRGRFWERGKHLDLTRILLSLADGATKFRSEARAVPDCALCKGIGESIPGLRT